MLVCPKQPWMLVCDADPRIRIPRPCGTYRCECCRPAKVSERVRVMAWSLGRVHHVRHITLTRVPERWQKARMQLRDLWRRVRKAYRVECGWSIEENPRETGYHAHAMSWGEYIPHHRLMEMWGGRICYLNRMDTRKDDYLTKCLHIAGYLSKNIATHLELNGGRALHMTRGFLHGRTSRQVLQELSTGRSWHLEHATPDEVADATPRKWQGLDAEADLKKQLDEAE